MYIIQLKKNIYVCDAFQNFFFDFLWMPIVAVFSPDQNDSNNLSDMF